MTKPSPLTTLTRGYAASKPPGKEPLPFRTDDRLERLRTLRQKDPTAFASFGPTQRIELGLYEQSRQAAGYEEDDHGDKAA